MYLEIKDFIKGKWLNIALIMLVIGFVNVTLSSIFVSNSVINVTQQLLNAIVNDYEFSEIMEIAALFRGNFFITLMISFISLVLDYTLMIVIKDAYTKGNPITFGTCYNVLKENILSLSLFALIVSAISSTFSFIPFVSLLVAYLSSFGPLYFSEEKCDTISAFRKSIKLGWKNLGSLILISFHYGMRIFSGFAVMILGFCLLINAILLDTSIVLGLLLVLGGVIIAVFLSVYYAPHITCVYPIYFSLQRDDEIDVVIDIEI